MLFRSNAASVTYGDSTPNYSVTVTGFANSESTSTAAGYIAPTCSSSNYTTSTNAATANITYTCTGGSANNYSITNSGSGAITINKATLTVTPDAKSVTYGGAAPTYTFAVAGFKNSETSSTAASYVAPTCSSSYTTTTNVSSSPVSISCSGGSATNYSFKIGRAHV